MRGVIIAGGDCQMACTTVGQPKQLLMVGRYPMIYYALWKMRGVGIRNIMIVTGIEHAEKFQEVLCNNKFFQDVKISYCFSSATGSASLLAMTELYIANSQIVPVMLGDNIFFDSYTNITKEQVAAPQTYAWLVLKEVAEPQKYCVAETVYGTRPWQFGNRLVSIERNPIAPKDKFAVTGICFYPNDVFTVIHQLEKGERLDLDLFEVNEQYRLQGRIGFSVLGSYWYDIDTYNELKEAGQKTNVMPPLPY